jgi:undecaprenyl diphosphate synthase
MSAEPAVQNREPANGGLRIPVHLGVIMDGNGRWARQRGKPRTDGHVAGVKALRKLVELSIDHGIEYLTVFSFSSENWTRPREEVRFILGLLRRFIAADLETLIRNNVRVKIIGRRDDLDESLRRLLVDAETKSALNTGLNLIVAFNYGGRAELVEATKRLAEKVRAGVLAPEAITEEAIGRELYTAGIPDPDVILRTSGEERLSNFLLWQSAYAELVFVDEYWPDFDAATFTRVLGEYTARDRRFGGIGSR